MKYDPTFAAMTRVGSYFSIAGFGAMKLANENFNIHESLFTILCIKRVARPPQEVDYS